MVGLTQVSSARFELADEVFVRSQGPGKGAHLVNVGRGQPLLGGWVLLNDHGHALQLVGLDVAVHEPVAGVVRGEGYHHVPAKKTTKYKVRFSYMCSAYV